MKLNKSISRVEIIIKKAMPEDKRKKIDWDLVAKFLEAGCLGTGIAAYIGIHPNTLYTSEGYLVSR